MFSKPYLEVTTKRYSLKLVFLKCWQQKQLFSGTAIFKEYLSLAATVYYLSDLNQNLWCLRIFFFSKPLFTQKEKLNLKRYNSTLLDIYIYRISVGEKLKNIKRQENIIILIHTHK